MVTKLLIAFALFLNGCANHGPLPEGELVKIPVKKYWEFENLKRIEPEPIYQEWFVELEVCLEETADFEEIYWYSASYGQDPNGFSLDGVHYRPNNKTAIILIDSDKETVTHEMAHFILRTNEKEGHHWIPRFWACVKAES
ncbi:hypothetical protein LCGC14_2285440 [marine sediment metagenome]|uniref:Uncharacterized protein n=1 Tax=marine sediment metagenome TaxID=412755 RepID=A0A0F9DF95_9ZZZZ